MDESGSASKSVAELAQLLVAAHEEHVRVLQDQIDTLRTQHEAKNACEVLVVPPEFHDAPRVMQPWNADAQNGISLERSMSNNTFASASPQESGSCAAWRRFVEGSLKHTRRGAYDLRPEFAMEYRIGSRTLCHEMRDTVLEAFERLEGKASIRLATMSSLVVNMVDGNSISRFSRSLMLYPYSSKRTYWLVLGLLALLCDFVDLSLEAFRLNEGEARMIVIRYCVVIYWCLDIPFSFLSGVAVGDRVEMRPKQVAFLYARGWFLFDVLALLPQIIDMFLQDLNDAVGLVKHLKVLRFSRFIRMIRIAKLKQIMKAIDAQINSTGILLSLRMAGTTACIVLWIHISACMWYLAGYADPAGWVVTGSVSDLPLSHRYLLSVQWAAAQLQGSTSITPGDSPLGLAVATVIIIMSVVFIATFFSRLTNTMHELLQRHNSRVQRMTRLKEIIAAHNVSPQLSFTLQRYARLSMHVDEDGKCGINDEVIGFLPHHLQRMLLVEILFPKVMKHVVFVAIRMESVSFFNKILCDGMQQTFYHNQETLFSWGQVASNVFIVVAGVPVYTHSRDALFRLYAVDFCSPMHSDKGNAKRSQSLLRTRFVAEGTLVGEAAFWIPWSHEGDLVAENNVSMLYMKLFFFNELLQDFPDSVAGLKLHAERFAAIMNDRDEEARDLLDSLQVLRKSNVVPSGRASVRPRRLSLHPFRGDS